MGQNFLSPDVLKNISLECLKSQNCLSLNKIYLGSECETFLKNKTSIFIETIKLKCLDFYITALQEMLKYCLTMILLFKIKIFRFTSSIIF